MSSNTGSSQLDLNLLLGSILVSTWINSSLYTLELILGWQYWKTATRKTRFTNYLVIIVILADSLCSFANFSTLYIYCVKSFGRIEKLLEAPVWLPIDVLLTGFVGALVEEFLICRIYRLMISFRRSALEAGLLTATLTLANITAFAHCVWVSVLLRLHPALEDRSDLHLSLTIWLASAAGIDFTVALILVVLFWRVKQSVVSFTASRSDGVLRLLIQMSIASGAMPTAAALATLVSYYYTSRTLNCNTIESGWVANPLLNADIISCSSTAWGFVHGRLYALSLLGNLAMRKSLMPKDPPSSGLVTTDGVGQRGRGITARSLRFGVEVAETSNFDDLEGGTQSRVNDGPVAKPTPMKQTYIIAHSPSRR